VCNPPRGICFDGHGPSIGLTEAFLGRAAATRLTEALRDRGAVPHGTAFSPADGVECVVRTGPCLVAGQRDDGLTALLFGPAPPREISAEAAALTTGRWRWVASRYGDGRDARPSDPARYTLELARDGTLQGRADCNALAGRYRLEGSRVRIEITRLTRALCAPDSLDTTYLRDLEAAAIYFLRQGRLYLDLRYDTGTMELERE
jgi:heat shock protein HslJ